MPDFIIKKIPYDITSNASLALVGQYTKRLEISALVDRKFPEAVCGITNSDILKPCLGLIVQNNNDFAAIEKFQGDTFFTRALDSSTTTGFGAWVPLSWSGRFSALLSRPHTQQIRRQAPPSYAEDEAPGAQLP